MNQTKGCLLSKFSIRISYCTAILVYRFYTCWIGFMIMLFQDITNSLRSLLGKEKPTRNRLIQNTAFTRSCSLWSCWFVLVQMVGTSSGAMKNGGPSANRVKGVKPRMSCWYRMSMDFNYPFLQIGCLRSVNRWNKPILRTSYDHFLGHPSSWCSPCLVRTEMERFGATGSVKSLHNKEHIRLRSISTSQHV